MASVKLDSVHKTYGSTPVVKGISLDIASGELVSLLGPSGCGKTTTLRMIAGLEHLDAGTISIGEQVVDGARGRVPPEQRRLGMVFQSYAVWPHKSVAQNVAYPLQLQRVAGAEIARRVQEALEWVRLGPFAERMPSQLSGGQLQRVAIARALVASPKVLLLDEPLSNLDAALREELRGEIASLRARLGTTMIFVTHDQHEALALSDRVAVMNRGVIEQIDAPQRLYANPATAFVAGFVGGANRLEGRVERGAFVCQDVRFPLPPSLLSPADRPATLAVRAESIALGGDGPALPLLAKLFLGHATEYRLKLGDGVLRAIGPDRAVKPGELLTVRFEAAHLF
ncbi:MAG: ABC transporter ATP-binding protein [Myxococcota bacterium]